VTFLDRAREVVRDYAEAHLDVTDGEQSFDVYVVWFAKTLGNWKALVSTTLTDGMYYEVTYDGVNKRIYLDAYKKFENKVIPD
jgi:methionine synthase II (cobalamin-independent)